MVNLQEQYGVNSKLKEITLIMLLPNYNQFCFLLFLYIGKSILLKSYNFSTVYFGTYRNCKCTVVKIVQQLLAVDLVLTL